MSKFTKKANKENSNIPLPVHKLGENTIERDSGDSSITAILDGDELAFVVAAACEERGIEVTNMSNEAKAKFKNRTELKNFLQSIDYDKELFSIADTQIPEPLVNATGSLKRMINNYK